VINDFFGFLPTYTIATITFCGSSTKSPSKTPDIGMSGAWCHIENPAFFWAYLVRQIPSGDAIIRQPSSGSLFLMTQ